MADKVRALPPSYVFLDNSGNALASGTINTYIEGTTTNKTTYTDQAGGTSNANPVVLDSNGRAEIWLDTNAGYKFLIKNSAGTTISTIDNIFGIPNDELQIADAKGIYDENGNEQLIFQTTASAVNYAEITNAATTTAVLLQAAGSDTNIDLDIKAKGTGTIDLSGAAVEIDNGATGAGEIRLLEDSDNGTNYMGFKAPAAVTTNLSLVLPNGDGTANQALVTDAAGTLSWRLVAGQATQAAIEAETNEDTYIPPDLIKHSPGVAKAWCLYTEITTTAITVSYNITSVSDLATGYTSVNLTTGFATANWVPVAAAGNEDGVDYNATIAHAATGITASAVRILHSTDAGTDTDVSKGAVAMFGDFA